MAITVGHSNLPPGAPRSRSGISASYSLGQAPGQCLCVGVLGGRHPRGGVKLYVDVITSSYFSLSLSKYIYIYVYGYIYRLYIYIDRYMICDMIWYNDMHMYMYRYVYTCMCIYTCIYTTHIDYFASRRAGSCDVRRHWGSSTFAVESGRRHSLGVGPGLFCRSTLLYGGFLSHRGTPSHHLF